MKHSVLITILLIAMFFIAQLIGIAVVSVYSPQTIEVTNDNGQIENQTIYNLPYGLDPPPENNPSSNLISIVVALAVAITLIFFLMKFNAEIFLRLWFFIVIALALGISLNAAVINIPYSTLIVLILAIPLAYFKIFKPNMIVHNITELLIYPGIAAIFVPLLNVFTIIILLIFISLYDMYAVWHSGFMQKMANYQIKTLKLFSGFFIPYLRNKEKVTIVKNKSKSIKSKSVKVNVAILGGGDVVFPIMVAGVVLRQFSLIPALIVALCATLALAGLFYISEKGKFYPAMPFISVGCFIALGIIHWLY
ncbi:hypothetical protein COU54_01945 [Candidatus Pacearchaeota archaeon CG10_big_fil_rev_8_21_14_0_10_31_24]|nr:MAG: hypothetical protein COU54_01945 [Candidatus Pacearchaeota archaeon CG10_big_fil_rev_8_21_14_0_10_31_24]